MTGYPSVTAAVLPGLLADPHQPRITYYDREGSRTELSTASLLNWAAKVAGLLVDDLGAAIGDIVAVRLSPGWLHLPILLGSWWAGLAVTGSDRPDAVAAFVEPGADAGAEEVFVVSHHPLGLPVGTVLAHQRDAGEAIRPQADRYPGRTVGPSHLALSDPDLTVPQVLARAQAADVPAGARLLCTSDWTLPDPGLPTFLGPLLAAGSLVQVHPDWANAEHLASISAVERCSIR